MFNTPSAPLGKVFRRQELEAIAEVLRRHPQILIIADEARTLLKWELNVWGARDGPSDMNTMKNMKTLKVYERCVYDKVEHFHFAALPGMFERTMTLFSVGKTFSCTGWRVGS